MRSKDYKIGMLCAIFSAVTWGFLPIYWQALRPVVSVVIIFYRIIFVAIVTFVASLKLYGMEGIKAPLRIKGNKLKFFLAGLLITLNWSIYIAAVNADFVIQTCIGYYIEPIIISVFGVTLFNEKLGKYKTIALVFGVASNLQLFLLSLIGFCTAVPLILFTMGANRITMVSLGIIEYISPSITLLLGIFLFKEAFDSVQFFSFVVIWIGLVFFTYGEYKEQNRKDIINEK